MDAEEESMRRSDWLVGGVLAAAFLPAVLSLARVWASVDYYSHGFLVPVMAWWAAQRRGRLLPRTPVRDPGGALVIAGSVALYALGLAAGLVELQGLGLVLAVAGVVHYLGGRRQLRRQAFPVAFLLFMVPLPGSWVTPLIVQLQLLVSGAAVDVLQLLGLAVTREGNVLRLPGGESLFVAEACSGITSIVTLTPLAVVLAYFTVQRPWRRVAIVASVFPVAMLGNLLRVLATVVAADAFGVEPVTGSALHDFAGLITFSAACLAMIGVGALVRRLPAPA